MGSWKMWACLLVATIGARASAAEEAEAPKADVWYHLECKASAAFVEIKPEDIQQNGAKAQQFEGKGMAWQQFKFIPLDDRTYRIEVRASGKCLDATAHVDINKDGEWIQQWDWHGGANQRWRIEKVEKGFFKLTNAASGKVLDVDWWTIARNGAKIQQWQYRGPGATNQLFALVPVKE